MALRACASAIVLIVVAAGCKNTWREPRPMPCLPLAARAARDASAGGPACVDGALREARSMAWQAGLADRSGANDAVDFYYLAALSSWNVLAVGDPYSGAFDEAWEIYRTSVARFMAVAREDGRIVPGQGIRLNVTGRPAIVPLAFRGSVWQTADVQSLHPVGDYQASGLSRHHQCDGWGVPVVVQREHPTGLYREEDFLAPGAVFAATALLRPDATGTGAVLELYNPLHPGACATPPPEPLAHNLSAPFAYREYSAPILANGVLPFLGIDIPGREGVFFLEPYQPGKIPVVMVHGLVSSPMSWIDLANDLRATPGFADRFQIWGFRYATGRPFLASAAHLRRDLYRAVATIDPAGGDPALKQIVLVGHSMGGLVSELQVASSEDRLWNAVANRPLECIVAGPAVKHELRELFFFDPQPNVRRVIFLATPHQGSNWALRPVGQIGSKLARTNPERAALLRQVLADNPGVFSDEVTRRVPSSIDMLNPNSSLLQAIESLPTNPCVHFHTVFGFGRFNLEGPGDGVVSTDSARSAKAESELGVRATHTTIHRKPATVDEVLRILRQHLVEAALGPALAELHSNTQAISQ